MSGITSQPEGVSGVAKGVTFRDSTGPYNFPFSVLVEVPNKLTLTLYKTPFIKLCCSKYGSVWDEANTSTLYTTSVGSATVATEIRML
jgi:hypothetical protein